MKALARFEYTMQLDAEHPILTNHRVHEERLLPGVTFLDMIARLLASEGLAANEYQLSHILFRAPIKLAPGEQTQVKVSYDDQQQRIVVAGQIQGQTEWVEHCRCQLELTPFRVEAPFSLNELQASARETVSLESVYDKAKKLAIKHGPFMQGQGTAYIGDDYVLANIALSDAAKPGVNDYFAHPALMDSMTVVPFAAGLAGGQSSHPYIPIAIDGFSLSGTLGERVWVLAKIAKSANVNDDVLHNNLWLLNDAGEVIGRFQRLTAKRIRSAESIQQSQQGTAQVDVVAPAPVSNVTDIIREQLAAYLKVAGNRLDGQEIFYELGLDSSGLLELVTRFEEIFNTAFYPTMLFEHNTIEALAAYLQGMATQGKLTLPSAVTPATDGVQTETLSVGVKASDTQNFNVQTLVASLVAKALNTEVAQDENAGFYDLGLDSNDLLGLVTALEQMLDVSLYPTLLFEHNSIKLLSDYLQTQPITLPTSEPRSQANAEHLPEAGVESTLGMFAAQWVEAPLSSNNSNTNNHSLLLGDVMASYGLSQTLETSHRLATNTHNVKGLAKLDDILSEESALTQVIWCVPVASHQDVLAMALALAQALIRSGKTLSVYVISSETNGPGCALSGFWKSLRHEVTRLQVRQLLTAELQSLPLTAELQHAPQGVEVVRYDGGARQRQSLAVVDASIDVSPLTLEGMDKQGAIVISGGFGGIGIAYVQHLFAAGFRAFALLGRSEPSADVQAVLQTLVDQGAEILCLQANLADYPQVQLAWRKIKNRFLTVTGVIHTAGVLRDALVKDKSQGQVAAVLAGKVSGAEYLDLLSIGEPLAFFMCCGSIAGAIGNLGQSDYAYANAALEGFAARREKMVQRGERKGRSLTLHWPLWRDGGMSLGEARTQQLKALTGLDLLTHEQAMSVFEAALNQGDGYATYLPVTGDLQQFSRHLQTLGLAQAAAESSQEQPLPAEITKVPAPITSTISVEKTADSSASDSQEPLAIVGLAGVYPGSDSLDEFWRNVLDGVDGITEVPESRWDHKTLMASDTGVYGKWGAFLNNAAQFDASFFGITPKEAELMDPQERLFLQVAWHAFEDAGMPLGQAKHADVGVFVGAMWSQYQLLSGDTDIERKTASIFSAIANRVSYTLNLKGPSMALDTMCSSALSALHIAIESVRRGDCTMALVGGVNVMSHPHKYQFLCQNKMLSTDGRCRSFGENGSGYVPGEGVGAVLIKPLSAAQRDGDNIHAVIRGSALSHGGRVAGMTVPHPQAQADVIQKALKEAAVSPSQVSVIEAHGTGTSLGDPIELDGLKKVFAENSASISVGSVKSNIGHLESAAGIAALSKVVMQLKHKTLAPSLHSQSLNPKLRFENTQLHIQQRQEPWVVEGARIAGISAFGAGGSNAHVVVEEFNFPPAAAYQQPVIIPISARDEQGLVRYAQRWYDFLADANQSGISSALAADARLVDIAHTAQCGRDAMAHRLALVCTTAEQAQAQLGAFLKTHAISAEFTALLIESSNADLAALAQSYMAGDTPQWPALTDACPRRTSIPAYPFNATEYWYQADVNTSALPVVAVNVSGHPYLKASQPRLDGAHFHTSIERDQPWVAQHVIQDRNLLPGMVSLSLMVDAVKALSAGAHNNVVVDSLTFAAPVDVTDSGCDITTAVYAGSNGEFLCETTSGELAPRIHTQATVRLAESSSEELATLSLPTRWETATPLYQQFTQQGLAYGPLFRCIEAWAQVGADKIWAKLAVPADADEASVAMLTMDAALQASVLLQGDITQDETVYLPYQLHAVQFGGDLGLARYVEVTRLPESNQERHFSLALLDEAGACLWRVEQFTLRAIAGAKAAESAVPQPLSPLVQQAAANSDSEQALRDAVQKMLVEQLVKHTGLKARAITKADSFDQVGIDSIVIMNVTAALETMTGSLPKTLFFEYGSVKQLTDYLMAEHTETLASHLSVTSAVQSASAKAKPVADTKATPKALTSFAQRPAAKSEGAAMTREPIAIVGIAGRYPDAQTPEQLWENLQAGRDSVGEVPAERWDIDAYYNPDKNHKNTTYCRQGGFIDKAECFDPGFFNITPADAIVADPQERIFLQTAWHALEDAGYARRSISGKAVGVFAAVMWNQYQLFGLDKVLSGDQAGALSVASSIANRLSYTMNINGPSLTLDTMCSSSLTAMHLAVQAIWNKECESAFVGGVNLSLHPHKYLSLCSNNFLSSNGRCSAFGIEADGYVPAEGVGVVYVKPLAQAEADGDTIYGVIRATAVNHVGRTSGATVPSPDAQATLIRNALDQAGVDPHSISYIEAHGTGTALGDPIEIRGLNKALNADGQHPGCRIGSIKANIGHAESAAGIASLTKVLMQLKHDAIAPSLHASPLNPKIDFADTPFEVSQTLSPWLSAAGQPRRAGISSFGAGGSNAHVVIEEYIDQRPAVAELGSNLLVLSARNRQQLTANAQQLHDWLLQNEGVSLTGLCFTLQQGREQMDHRFAVAVSTVEEAIAQLADALVQGFASGHGYSCDQSQDEDDEFSDSEGQSYLSQLLNNQRWSSIARLWCRGVDINWQAHYPASVRRLNLPGYVFAEQRLMFDLGMDGSTQAPRQGHSAGEYLHNISDVTRQAYRSRLPVNHPWLADHVIQGHALVPMAWLVSVINSAAAKADPSQDWQLANISLDSMVLAKGEALVLEVDIEPQSEACLLAHLYQMEGANERLLASVELAPRQAVDAIAEASDIAFNSAQSLYQTFAEAGFSYGKHYRQLRSLSCNATEGEALLEGAATEAADVTAPGVIDAALQLTREFTPANTGPWFPQTLNGFWISPSAVCTKVKVESLSSSDNTLSFRVYWLDAANVVVGYCDALTLACEQTTAQPSPSVQTNASQTASSIQATPKVQPPVTEGPLALVTSRWVDADALEAQHQAKGQNENAPVWTLGAEHLITGAGTQAVTMQWANANNAKSENSWELQADEAGMTFLADKIKQASQAPRIIVSADAASLDGEQLYWCLWHLVRASMAARVPAMNLVVALSRREYTPVALAKLQALQSWMQALGDERPGYQMRLVESDAALTVQQWLAPLKSVVKWSRYDEAQRWQVRGFEAIDFDVTDAVATSGRQTVLITGGAGGLGSLFAKHLAKHHASDLILVGRKAQNEDITQLLAELRELGSEAVYYPADMGDSASIQKLARKIKLRFGELTGVVHAAGYICDNYIVRQQASEVASVLQPKVAGTEHLLEMLKGLTAPATTPWMVGFSSISGFLGHAGQADYSYANAVMDALLHNAQGVKGLTINWPLWSGVGMQVSDHIVEMMASQTGMQPLPVDEGLKVFDQMLCSNAKQVMPLYGNRQAMLAWLGNLAPFHKAISHSSITAEVAKPVAPAITGHMAVVAQPEVDVRGYVLKQVAAVVAAENGFAPDDIDWSTGLDSYGFSSVAISAMTHALEQTFGELSKTLFFECTSLGAVVDYLCENHAPALASEVTVSAGTAAVIKPVANAIAPSASSRRVRGSRFVATQTSASIAIVGAAGRFPQADSLDELWQCLSVGQDCVSKVPADRWQTGDAFDPAFKGGFMRDVDKFDANFFSMGRKEATATDPHERLFLQSVWHSMEDAGLKASDLAGQPVGVYVGAMWGQYQLQGLDAWRNGSPDVAVSSFASVANRISYFFDFKGPSLTLDSMCSSGMVALKMAVDALASGEIEYAIVGGVNSSVHPYKYRQLKESMFLSSEGCCRAFGADGDGYVPGEGIISFVLCRDQVAQAQKLRVRAYTKGVAIAHGGRGNGYYVPNPNEQAKVIQQALDKANVPASSVSYIEAHGTGTALGDPIEVKGLQQSYFSEGAFPCAIGSVKANIGHLESAAGLASICKVLLQMEHDQLVPSIHSTPQNPKIDFSRTGLAVQRELASWSAMTNGKPLRAGVSSFGAGGTNSHVILEAAPVRREQPTAEDVTGNHLFVLSAKDRAGLDRQVASYCQWLKVSDAPAANIAAASQNDREALDIRMAVLYSTRDELIQQLEHWLQAPQYQRVAVKSVQVMSLPMSASDELLAQAKEAWLKGTAINNDNTARVALPLYVFAAERHWVDAKAANITAHVVNSADVASVQVNVSSSPAETAVADASESIELKLLTLVGDILGYDSADMEPEVGFDAYGMDSVQAGDLAKALSNWIGEELSPTAFYNYPNIAALTEYLQLTYPSLSVSTEIITPVQTAPVVKVPEAINTTAESDAVAIVGMSGAFAGAPNLDAFWQNLQGGVDAVKEVPASRWNLEDYFDPSPNTPGKTYSRRMGLMTDVDQFDPTFFGVLADEAQAMDPQQRQFLMHAFYAIEDAAINFQSLQGSKTGVYCGAMATGYRELLTEEQKLSALSMMGNHNAVLPARVSYWLDLKGPSITVDTACSASLQAIHLACQALKTGDCELAIAGGVFVTPTHNEQVACSAAGMLSKDGQCKTFSDEANGIAIGEGVGVIVLKPLSQAIKDKDPIHAVIRGSGSNQDGKTNGLTAPNALAQSQLIGDVIHKAQLDVSDVQYIETHGTGTRLGDPVEIEGLKNVFNHKTDNLIIGALKPNIGHTYAAAGVASLMKATLAIKNANIPPSIHAEPNNPLMALDSLPFTVNTRSTVWPTCNKKIAGVSAFSFSGTNVHVLVEEAPAYRVNNYPKDSGTYMLPVSARNSDCLKQQAKQLADYLGSNTDASLYELSFTLQTGRAPMDFRRCLIVKNIDDAISQLIHIANSKDSIPRVLRRKDRPSKALGEDAKQEKDLSVFVNLWQQGMAWDWKHEFSEAPYRLHLPTSTLSCASYWPPVKTERLDVSEKGLPTNPAVTLIEVSHHQFKKIA